MINTTTLITSLLAHRSTMENPLIADGVANHAAVIRPLRSITRSGRALNSDDEFALNKVLGHLLSEYFQNGDTDEAVHNAVAGLTVMISLILRSAVEIKPDLLVEEILMNAVNQDAIRDLEQEFSAVPVFHDSAGSTEVGFGLHKLFCAAIPLTDHAADGFIDRNIAKYLKAAKDENDATSYEFVEDETPVASRHFHLESLEGELIADAMNGFDEFYERYFGEDYRSDEDW